MLLFAAYCDRLRMIFASSWLINDSNFVRQLESALSDYLGCPHFVVCNNDTTALMLALHCAGLRGKKVAVTAYAYVATLSALIWIGCTPVFVDIDPQTLCMSQKSFAQALADHLDFAGVVPMHIYGLACDDTSLSATCRANNARLIYDAAHALGSTYQSRSLLNFGDYSVCSFHAIKLFHTVEGGCIVAHSEQAREGLALARAFGHRGDIHYTLGINAKMSELHAAMGLCLLPHFAMEIAQRRVLHAVCDETLAGVPLSRPQPSPELDWNYAYYPVLLPDSATLHRVVVDLEAESIYPHHYFFPALTTLPYMQQWRRDCPVAEDVAQRILCLPMYGDRSKQTVQPIASVLSPVN